MQHPNPDCAIYLPDKKDWFSVDEAKRLAAADGGAALEASHVRACFPDAILRGIDEQEKSAEFVISTESPVRDSYYAPPTSLDSEGVNLERFRANPVVLFMHEQVWTAGVSSLPRVEGKSLVARVTFDAEDDLGAWLWGKVRRKIIRMASVGFRKLAWYDVDEGATDAATGLAGPVRRATEWELLEWSVVAIGANAEALGRGLSGASAQCFPWVSARAAREPEPETFSLDNATQTQPGDREGDTEAFSLDAAVEDFSLERAATARD